MMSWLEDKYANLLSSRLDRFKRVNQNYNFRCPLCSDSKKSKSKARGWILKRDKGTRFYCHNCGASLKFAEFLKRVDINLFYDFVKDRYLEDPSPVKKPEPTFKSSKPSFQIGLKRISQLPVDHPAKLYVQRRMIPSELHFKLYYAPKFKKWVNTLIPDKYKYVENDEPRLIIPLLDEAGIFFGFQGRSFRRDADDKYITILLDDRKPKLFGLDVVDPTKGVVYVVEGPIDAMFIPNCLASCGGRLDTNVGGDPVLIYDNENRSVETVKKIDRAIKDGHRVVIWPDEVNFKDINDMVLNGFTVKQIMNIIEENTFSGLTAELRLIEWKKV